MEGKGEEISKVLTF